MGQPESKYQRPHVDDESRGSPPQWNRTLAHVVWAKGGRSVSEEGKRGLGEARGGGESGQRLGAPRAQVVTLWVMGQGEGHLPGGTPEQLVGHRGPGGWAALREAHPQGSHHISG